MDKKNTPLFIFLFLSMLIPALAKTPSVISISRQNPTTNESYTKADSNLFAISSITRNTTEITNEDEVAFTIVFNQNITTISSNNFLIQGTTAPINTSLVIDQSQIDIATSTLNNLNQQLSNLQSQLTTAIEADEADKTSQLLEINRQLVVIANLMADAEYMLDNPNKEAEARNMIAILLGLRSNLLNQKTVLETTESDTVTTLRALTTSKEAEVTTAQNLISTLETSNEVVVTISGGDLADLNGTITLNINPTNNITSVNNNPLASFTSTGTNENTYTLQNADLSTTLINSLSKEIKVYQNGNTLTIKSPFKITSVEILDFTGSKIFKTVQTSFKPNIATGIYILKLETEKGWIFKKFVK